MSDQTAVSRTVLSVVRILIASYFLATGSGLIIEPTSRMFFDAVLSQQNAALLTTSYLFITAFAIMVGRAVRPAALLLAIYIFWSGFVHYRIGGSPEALSAYWRDMALLGAVLLIAVTEPGGSGKFKLWRKSVAPRRIMPSGQADRPVAGTKRPTPEDARTARDNVKTDHNPGHSRDFDDDDDNDDDGNIFADIWDIPLFSRAPSAIRIPV
jgi:uncharacterized membrane protein YphA (DoxX/SURF4 family)